MLDTFHHFGTSVWPRNSKQKKQMEPPVGHFLMAKDKVGTAGVQNSPVQLRLFVTAFANTNHQSTSKLQNFNQTRTEFNMTPVEHS